MFGGVAWAILRFLYAFIKCTFFPFATPSGKYVSLSTFSEDSEEHEDDYNIVDALTDLYNIKRYVEQQKREEEEEGLREEKRLHEEENDNCGW